MLEAKATAPALTVIHGAFEVAFQMHAAPVETLTLLDPPEVLKVDDEEPNENVQPAAGVFNA
jgi:hypothetical protein